MQQVVTSCTTRHNVEVCNGLRCKFLYLAACCGNLLHRFLHHLCTTLCTTFCTAFQALACSVRLNMVRVHKWVFCTAAPGERNIRTAKLSECIEGLDYSERMAD